MRLRFWEWWPWWSWRVVGVVEAADDVPGRLPPRAAVLVGDRKTPKWLSFDCPCRNNHRILVNLDERRRPVWRLAHGRKLSISPSIDALGPVGRCHFFITSGRVKWV